MPVMASGNSKDSERRFHPRYLVVFSVTVVSEASPQTMTGKLLDVSEGGVRLFLPRPLPVGTRLDVDLKTPVMSFTLSGRVVWADAEGGPHLHGVVFEMEQGPPFAQRLFDIARQSW